MELETEIETVKFRRNFIVGTFAAKIGWPLATENSVSNILLLI